PFLNEYVDEIVRLMGSVYPEIVENRELERKLILSEEDRFGATLRQGQTYLEEALANLEGDTLAGEEAFTLHDTYGFPVEVTQEIAEARGVKVDLEGFEKSMAAQRERARAAGAKNAEAAWSTYGGVYADLLAELGPTGFVGYDAVEAEGRVTAVLRDGERVDALAAGEEGEVVLDVTPFYAEMGGEVGDTGVIENGEAHVYVLDCKAPEKGLVVHAVRAEGGPISVGDAVVARVDAKRRASIERNHTATHILHAALREVLGDHVKQAGSYVGPDRLRFDFTHFEAMTPEQIAEVERVANLRVMEAVPTNIYETSLDEARANGVTALFGEKYGETVRVVEAGDFSRELCGGCHVSNTAEIGFVKITSESSVGANLRRIEAVTSYGALAYVDKVEAELKEAAAVLRVPLFDVSERTAANAKALKEFQQKGKRAKEMIGGDAFNDLLAQVQEAPAGYPVIIARTEVREGGQMRNLWDVIRTRMERPGAMVVAGVNDGKPVLMAAGTDEAVAAGFDAGALIKAMGPAIQGGGGGKPTMAQAGGKNPDGIDDALEIARNMVL
ncbi:MAG: alanine--tRNA ligase, partial [Eggerthellaceae bacterium]|nr:alanine--tRNA ligase [Eggerthellaceae bacterium]